MLFFLKKLLCNTLCNQLIHSFAELLVRLVGICQMHIYSMLSQCREPPCQFAIRCHTAGKVHGYYDALLLGQLEWLHECFVELLQLLFMVRLSWIVHKYHSIRTLKGAGWLTS
jgi:hypothetical protein